MMQEALRMTEAIIMLGNSRIDDFSTEKCLRIRRCSHPSSEALSLKKTSGMFNALLIGNCTVRCSRGIESCLFYLNYHYDKVNQAYVIFCID